MKIVLFRPTSWPDPKHSWVGSMEVGGAGVGGKPH